VLIGATSLELGARVVAVMVVISEPDEAGTGTAGGVEAMALEIGTLVVAVVVVTSLAEEYAVGVGAAGLELAVAGPTGGGATLLTPIDEADCKLTELKPKLEKSADGKE
jgi:hypothetical protein